MSKVIRDISFHGLVAVLCGLAMFAASDAQSAMIVGGNGFRCMDVRGPSTADGTPIQAFDCHGAFNQQFNFINGDIRGIGTLDFSTGVNKCLDVAGFPDGSPVRLMSCTGGNNQKWNLNRGRLISLFSGRCVDLGTGVNGTQLVSRSCNGSAAQTWVVR